MAAQKMGLLERMLQPVIKSASDWYCGIIGKRLAKYGLRYDDLLDPIRDADIAEAIRRLPPQVLLERNARLRRAAHLGLQKETLTGELLAKQTPWEPYLTPYLEEVKAERRERAKLGTLPPYSRTLP